MKKKTNFKRLVTRLPFNPSLINQLSFYGKRLRKESSVRRIGFIFIALTFFIQFFAVIAPPQSSMAQDTDNDIIRGGFQSQAEGVTNCTNNVQGFNEILGHFGITCGDLQNGTPVTVRSTDNNRQLMSLGRKPYGKANEQTLTINNNPFYIRSLWAWDQGYDSTYQAIQGTTANGLTFFILYDCGNPVFVGVPPPPPPPAVKSVNCSLLLMDHENGAIIKKGTKVAALGHFNGANMGPGDVVNMNYDYVNADTGVAVVQPTPANGVPFNNGRATDTENRYFVMNTPGRFTFRLAGTYNGALIPGSFTGACSRTISVEVPPVTCVENPDMPKCKPCEESKDNNPIDCLVKSKNATNVTTNTPNANNTTANPGDVITYTLFTKNTGKVTIKKYIVSESMSDVLDYAEITDLHGGIIDKDNIVRWPAVDMKAGQTVKNQITIKVKSPIPSTPTSISNPGKYDLIMTNVYGDTVNIKLPPTIIKITETTTTTLPNTGPGTNIAIAFVLVTVAGYFLARTRLQVEEIDIIRHEYGTGV
jgi:uncharacterized repeat protein (TIGR01451 family)